MRLPPTRRPSARRVRLEKWWEILCEQTLNSAVVAGITSLTIMSKTGSLDIQDVVVPFSLTFLIEVRKYRKI